MTSRALALALGAFTFVSTNISSAAGLAATGTVDALPDRPAQVVLGATGSIEAGLFDLGPTARHARQGGASDTALGGAASFRARQDLGLRAEGAGATTAALYPRWQAALGLDLATDRDFALGVEYRRLGDGLDANVYAFSISWIPDPHVSLRAATWISPGKAGDAGALHLGVGGAALEGRLTGALAYVYGAARETPRTRLDYDVLRAQGARAQLGARLGPVTLEVGGSFTREDRERLRAIDHLALDLAVRLEVGR